MTEDIILIFFPTLMIFAAISDVLTFKIPNKVPLALIIGYVAVALYFNFSIDQIAQDVLCGFVILAISIAFFSLNLIGGGDAKLAAASALWLGWENLVPYGVFASIVGFVLAVIIIVVRFNVFLTEVRSLRYFERFTDKGSGVPFGVALALGGASRLSANRNMVLYHGLNES